MEFQHTPVLLKEVLEGLAIRPDGRYVDGTTGGAGHSSRIATRSHPKQMALFPSCFRNNFRSGIISRIAMETAQYGTDDGLVAVTLGNTVVAENIVPGRSFSIEVNNVNGSTLTISTTAKRAYISSVSIDVSSGSTPDNSSSSSSSTSNSSSSSESPVSSQNNSSSVEESSSNDNNRRQNNGCGGSIFVTSTLLAFASIIGLTVVFSKKKK